jgi:hypothetical protein
MVFTSDKVTLTRNSNVWCGPQSEVLLGRLERKAQDIDRASFAYLEQSLKREERKPAGLLAEVDPELMVEPPLRPIVGGARAWVSARELEPGGSQANRVDRIFRENCGSRQGWELVQGAKARVIGGKVEITSYPSRRVSVVPVEQADCQRLDGAKRDYLCSIPDYGQAWIAGAQFVTDGSAP